MLKVWSNSDVNGWIMSASHKTIVFLGVAAILLCVPLTVGTEFDEAQNPSTVTLATSLAPISLHAHVPARNRAGLPGMIAVAQSSVALRDVIEHVSTFVSRDGRSNLRSLCLLRC